MKQLLIKYAKWAVYPAFYMFALLICFYLTFPWDRVKDRVVAEFDKSQAAKGDKAWHLEIDSLSGYWLSGVEIKGAKITIPAADDDKPKASSGFGSSGGSSPVMAGALRGATVATDAPTDGSKDDKSAAKDKDAAKPGPHDSVMLVEKMHARVRLLPLLIGRIRIDFTALAFGGDVHGTIPVGGGTLDVELDHVDLSQVTPLRDLVTVPMKGIANGKLEMSSEGGKWAKASGALDVTVTDVAIGDGKAKLAGMATLPQATLGKLEISGKATDGLLKIDKFGATGKDVELAGDGYLRVKEPWDSSSLDFIIRFGFSDAYRGKDDKTKSLLGDPTDKIFPALIDQNPKMKQAKRDDGMYGFRGKGLLKALKWDPTQDDAPPPPQGGAAATSGADKDTSTKRKITTSTPPAKKKGVENFAPPPPREASNPEVKPPPSEQGSLPIETAAPPPVPQAPPPAPVPQEPPAAQPPAEQAPPPNPDQPPPPPQPDQPAPPPQ